MIINTNQQLVVTSVGSDRPGIVSELTKLASQCNCNILDSRMAIFGNEFTLIMLLVGDMAAISRIEHRLPVLGQELDLLTVTKRTSSHKEETYHANVEVVLSGKDRPGTLSTLTSFMAERMIDISSLKSDTRDVCNDSTNNQTETLLLTTLEIRIPLTIDIDEFTSEFEQLCAAHAIKLEMNRN